MNEDLLLEPPSAAAPDDFGTAADPDLPWRLATVGDLAAALAAVGHAAGYEGTMLCLSDPVAAGSGLHRLVEEGRRLTPAEPPFDPLAQAFADAVASATVPFRWRGAQEPEPLAQPLPPSILRDCGRIALPLSGLCIPVRSGLRRFAGLVFLGRGRQDLSARGVLTLRVFAMAWYSRFGQIEAAVGERVHVTPRERECLQLAANGLTSEAIARRLGLSKHTVDHHLVSATIKLKASNRAHAVAESLRLGIVA